MDTIGLIVALIACATALAAFGHRLVVQFMARIDCLGHDLRGDLDRRFAEAETHRVESSAAYRAAWDARHSALTERLMAQKEEIGQLRRQHDEDRRALVDNYVSRDTWVEHIGATNIKLDKLLEELRQHIVRTPSQ